MKPRFVGFALLVGLTLGATFLVWGMVQGTSIPAAVQAAHARGERLAACQILGVDLAGYLGAWVLWSAAAVGAYWWLARKPTGQPMAFYVFSRFALPLIVTSALLIVPLAL